MHTQAHERPSHEQPDSTELNFEQLEVVFRWSYGHRYRQSCQYAA